MDEKIFRPRRFVRYDADLEVVIQQAAEPFRGRITQISRGGCLIYPALPPQPTPYINLSFRLAEGMPSINCAGEIIYSIEERGSGVALSEISDYSKELITRFFEKQLPT
jgi:c-di-GMP-binding flagellar brake protein YcgR